MSILAASKLQKELTLLSNLKWSFLSPEIAFAARGVKAE